MIYISCLPRRAVEDIDLHRLVDIGQLLAVGRPVKTIPIARAIGCQLFLGPFYTGFTDGQLIFTGVVAPIGDIFSIGAPGRESLRHIRRLRKVFYRTILRWYREDITPGFDDSAFA